MALGKMIRISGILQHLVKTELTALHFAADILGNPHHFFQFYLTLWGGYYREKNELNNVLHQTI